MCVLFYRVDNCIITPSKFSRESGSVYSQANGKLIVNTEGKTIKPQVELQKHYHAIKR